MTSFVITNTGETPILIAGVELIGGSCRGCPIEHLDKIEAPKGATYFINYVGKPDIVTMKDKGDGEMEEIRTKQEAADITFNGKTMKAGERTEVIEVKEDADVKTEK